MHRRSFGKEGFAITVVVLITLLALGAFVFSAAVLGLASRSGTSSERNSIQALLAADSALDTLTVRAAVVETPPPPLDDLEEDQGQFEVWIGTPGASPSGLAVYDLGGGATASLVVLDEDDATVTVQAVGSFGAARRSVIQTFVKDVPDPEFLRLAIPGALTSVKSFKSVGGGNANVVGLGLLEEDWIFTTRMEGSPEPQPVPRQLCEARAGEYVEIDTVRYRVEDVRGCGPADVDLFRLDTKALSPAFDGSKSAGLIPFAVTHDQDFVVGETQSTIRVTDASPSLFPIDSPILVGDGVGTVRLINTITDSDTGEKSYSFTVDWAPAPGFLREGTVIRREVPAGVTAGICPSPDDDKVFDGDCVSGQTTELANLFVKTFGASIDAVSSIAQHIPIPSGNQEGNQEVVMESNIIKWMTLGTGALNLKGLRGAGVLVIDNRSGANLTLNVDNEMEGLIYVIGDVSLQGNALSRGAIVSDGDIEILGAEGELVFDENDGWTSVGGTMDLHYDPVALQRNVSNITMPSTQPPSLGASVPGTWRIR